LIVITGRHLRAARALIGWSQDELAAKAKVALRTITRMEGYDDAVDGRLGTLNRIVAVLEKAGVEFLNDGKPGVRIKLK
jgi:predicted transcriptional regulator